MSGYSLIYRKTEPQLWTVGWTDSSGKWEPESDWSTQRLAAIRIRWLNGGQLTDEEMHDMQKNL